MTFQKDKTTAAQTSANAAATVVGALVAEHGLSVNDAAEATVTIFEALFDKLGPIVDADNANFLSQDSGSSRSSSRSEKRSSKTSGGNRNKSKGGSAFKGDLDDALNLKLKFGAFEGETLGDVADLDADTCDNEFDYGDGERDGSDYIAWLSGSTNKNEYVRDAARLVAEDKGIDY